MSQLFGESFKKQIERFAAQQVGEKKEQKEVIVNNIIEVTKNNISVFSTQIKTNQQDIEVIDMEIAELAPQLNPKASEVRKAALKVERAEEALNQAFDTQRDILMRQYLQEASEGNSGQATFAAFVKCDNKDHSAKQVAAEVAALEQAKAEFDALRKDTRMLALEERKAKHEANITKLTLLVEKLQVLFPEQA